MTIERYCLKCHVISYLDDLEKVWRCDCTMTRWTMDEDGLSQVDDEPDYWIDLDIPMDVCICPKCGSSLWIDDITEWDGETGTPTESGLDIDCSTEPVNIDSDDWEDWFRWHWANPYVDWLPVKQRVYKWFLSLHLGSDKQRGG